MNIIKGKTKPKGLRVIIYGVHGIGKTTLAAKLPNSFFLDFEDGTHGLDVDKIASSDLPKSYAEMKGLVAELKRDHQGYERIIIDTADKFEADLAAKLAEDKKVEDIFAVNDFGRTIAVHKSGMSSVLDALSDLAKTGMDIVVLAHETSRKVEPLESRDTTGTYDHHEMKLSKTVSPVFMEWADVVIFCAYKTFLVSGEKKTDKAHVEGGKRWCFAAYSNDWDAKTRTGIGLPEDCSLDKMCEILPKAMSDAVDRGTKPVATSTDSAEEAAKAALARKRAETSAVSAPRQEQKPVAKAAPAAPSNPERECVASLRRLLGNYGVAEADFVAYATTNPKFIERYGEIGKSIDEWPDGFVSNLTALVGRNIDKIKAKIAALKQ